MFRPQNKKIPIDYLPVLQTGFVIFRLLVLPKWALLTLLHCFTATPILLR
jgi:hypothetical protein